MTAEVDAWPWGKVERQLQDAALDEQIPCVMVATGVRSPMHQGHLTMFVLARERLERAGFVVLGGWAVLASSAAEARMSASEPNFDMSDDFRRAAAAYAMEDNDLVALAQPQKADSDDIAATVSELQAVATERLRSQLPDRVRRVKTFYVCSSDVARKQRPAMSLQASNSQGVVVVLGAGDDMLEKTVQSLFVSERDAETRDVSSAKLRSALVSGDACHVLCALSPPAARFVLSPTEAERRRHAAEFAQLLGWARGDADEWPCAKFSSRWRESRQREALSGDHKLAVLVATEGVGAASCGYLRLLRQARDRLQRSGYTVLAAWITLCGRDPDEEVEFSSVFAAQVASLAVLDDDFVSVSSATLTGPGEASVTLQQFLKHKFSASLEGHNVSVFHVAGSDRATRPLHIAHSVHPESHRGAINVPLSEDEMLLEKPHSMLLIADPLPEEAAAVGPKQAVEALRTRDFDLVQRLLPAAAARFVMHPTEAERGAFATYFDRFGAPSAERAAATKNTLKQSFRAWVGPDASLRGDDLLKLVRTLDPSWTVTELEALRALTSQASDGSVKCDDLIDWAFVSSSR